METSTFLKVFLGCAALVMAFEISYLVRSQAYADSGSSAVPMETRRADNLTAGTLTRGGFNTNPPELDGCAVSSDSLLADAGLDSQDNASARDCDTPD